MGIDQNYIIDLDTDIFNCGICLLFVINPVQCDNCNKMFCLVCAEMLKKEKNNCPFKCKNNNWNLNPLPQSLNRIYYNLKIKCKICQNGIFIKEFLDHYFNCSKMQCINYEYCKKNESFKIDNISYCSKNCINFTKFQNIIKKDYTNIEIYNHIKNIENLNQTNIDYIYNKNKYTINNKEIFHNSKNKEFNSIVMKNSFKKKITIYELEILNKGNEMKFGLVKKEDFDLNKAFSDYDFGYSLMTNGQLRNGSGSFGEYFCEPFKIGKLKIIINFISYTIHYIFDDLNLGQAFKIENLEMDEFNLSVACYGNSSFKIKEINKIPEEFLEEIFNDIY